MPQKILCALKVVKNDSKIFITFITKVKSKFMIHSVFLLSSDWNWYDTQMLRMQMLTERSICLVDYDNNPWDVTTNFIEEGPDCCLRYFLLQN